MINIETFDKKSTFISLLHKKKSFIMFVLLSIILQIFFTIFMVNLYRTNKYLSNVSKFSFWIYLFITTSITLMISLLNLPLWIKIILFMIYAFIYSAMIHNASNLIPTDIIDQTLIGMISNFTLLTIFLFIYSYYNTNISWIHLIFIGFFIGLITDILLKFYYNKFINNKIISNINHFYMLYIGLILYSIFITYSTNVILRQYNNRDFITAAVDLYLGFVNTFIYIFELDKYI